jgi:aspartate/methionine/tyrosine aminotransferase
MTRLGTEMAFEVLSEVTALVGEGRDIITFGIGEPDFHTPENIKRAGMEAIRNDQTHYTPSAGLAECREAVARYVSRYKHADVDPEGVIVTPGAKMIIFFGLLACVDEGDEVVFPNPGYPIYHSMIDYVGAKGIPLPIREEQGFTFDVEELRDRVSDRTRMVILNSPSNPTGGVLSRSDLDEVARLAEKHDFWVLCDEIYSRMVYEGEFQSALAGGAFGDRLITMDGHSKIYSMTGWRFGYGVMAPALAAKMSRLMVNSAACTSTFVQLAAIEACEGPQDAADAMVAEFKERRALITDLLNDIDGVRCTRPAGAFYAFPNVTDVCDRLGLSGAEELQKRLLHEADVAVLARSCFGPRNEGEDQEYIRLSYATSKDLIEKGLGRMKTWIETR